MHIANIQSREIGVRLQGSAASVCVWAPEAKEVSIEINGAQIPLSSDRYGCWRAEDVKAQEGDLYSFIVDGRKLPDPVSLSQPQGVHGPSAVCHAGAFGWTDGHWKSPALGEYIIYELHVGTFTSGGTFEAVAEKLSYLKDLGVNAIELMPVSSFPGKRNWGYDGVFPFAAQHSYGGPRALQKLVDSCHNAGIAVILDAVYNHFGPEGNYLPSFAPYFTDKYKTPWGPAVNFDDAHCDGVRQYVVENALMWFRDFHIDALRLDAVHAIRDFSPEHILATLSKHTAELCAATGRVHHLIAECDLNDARFVTPLTDGGFGMNAQWADEFHHALRVAAGQERDGYYSDFSGVKDLAKAFSQAYVFTGEYSEFRKRRFGTSSEGVPGSGFVVFSQNHDQVGNRMRGERSSALVSPSMAKLMAATVMVSPFIPLLFMGEEWAASSPFLYFVDHGDPKLSEAVKKGRKEEFSRFRLQGEPPDPTSPATFDRSKLNWEERDQPPHKTMLAYYKALIALRKKLPALGKAERAYMHVECDEANGLIFVHRWHEEQHVLCMMNFSDKPVPAKVPAWKDKWKEIFLSSAEAGVPASPRLLKAGEEVFLDPESMLIGLHIYV